ncbi:MAG: hypothetical protein ABEH65_10835 [Halobacteriales archaeon]
MRDDILEAQRALIERIEADGWEVTEAELSTYESPFVDEDDPEASVTITARRVFPEDRDVDADDASNDDNPFRIR